MRRTETDVRATDDEARARPVGAGLAQGGVQCGGIVPVHRADDLPAVGPETARHFLGEPALHLAVNGNAVGVVEGNELAQFPDARQRAGLVGHALHQAAVTKQDIGMMIHNVVARPVEPRGQQFFGQRHAHG